MDRTVFFGQDVHAALEAERKAVCTPSKRVLGCYESESLCRWQSETHRKGFEGARLCETIFGWSARSDTGLDNFRILQGHRDGTRPNPPKEQALAWPKRCQPDRRTVR